MQRIYTVVALAADTGRFYTVLSFVSQTDAQAHAAELERGIGVATKVLESHLLPTFQTAA